MFGTSYNKHQCRASGCELMVPQDKLMCGKHWAMVPEAIQDDVYRTWRVRGENGAARLAYFDAANAAVKAAQTAETGASEDTCLIKGDSYPVREKLKALGGVWSPHEKGWRVPKAQRLVAEVLVGNSDQVETLPGLEDCNV